jgi:putative toxin-antitoxin system antitoxin component (TIGR02293 family)
MAGAPARKPASANRYLEVYRAAPLERIARIKRGVSANEAKRVIADLRLGQGEALKALKLSQATINRKARSDKPLTPDESERVIGMVKLVGQVQAMVEDSGEAEGFDAMAWLSRWLRESIPALGGARPFDLMDTMEGQALVSRTLAQMEGGAYA